MTTCSPPAPGLLGIEIKDNSAKVIARRRIAEGRRARGVVREKNTITEVSRLERIVRQKEKGVGAEPTPKQRRELKALKGRIAKRRKQYERNREASVSTP